MFKFTIPIELHNGTNVERLEVGRAKFDHETYFPCFALVLDKENAIILKANELRIFTRIGTVSSIQMGEVREAQGSNGLDWQGKKGSGKLAYSVEDLQAAEIANGSPQIVTIF